jgi:hypothetical protein
VPPAPEALTRKRPPRPSHSLGRPALVQDSVWEFGYWFEYWTEEGALLEGAERFLVLLSGLPRDSIDADSVEPDLIPFELDDVAMREAMAEMAG